MIPAIIAAGSNIAGSVLGSYFTGKSNEAAAEKNADIQRELAQNGLSWRVSDAKRAGINPLAALGASLPTGNPVAVGTDYGDLGLGEAGQNISRAMQAGMTKEQREMHELNKRLLQVQIDGQEIDNRKAAGTPPPMAIDPKPSIPLSSAEFPMSKGGKPYVVKPNEVIAADTPGVEAGPQAFYQKLIDDEGNARIVPTNQAADLVESYTPLWLSEMNRNVRLFFNSTLSNFSDKKKATFGEYLKKVRPKHDNPKYEYRWDLKKQVWTPTLKQGFSEIFVQPLYTKPGQRFKMPSNYKGRKK